MVAPKGAPIAEAGGQRIAPAAGLGEVAGLPYGLGNCTLGLSLM